MAFWSRFFSRKPRMRPVGQTLEVGTPVDPKEKTRKGLIKAAIFLGLIVLTMLAFPRVSLYEFAVEVDDTWNRDDLTAPFDFAYYKDASVLQDEREALRRTTPARFLELPNASEYMLANRDTVVAQVEAVFDRYRSFKLNQSRGRMAEATSDSTRYMALRRNARVKLSPEQWRLVLDAYAAGIPELSASSRSFSRTRRIDTQALQAAWDVSALMASRTIDVPFDSLRADEVTIVNEMDGTVRNEDKDNLFGLEEAYQAAQRGFEAQFEEEPEIASVAMAMFLVVFKPALEYQRAATIQEWNRLERAISPTEGLIERGDLIIEQGQKVTEEVRRQLISLERSQAERLGRRVSWSVVLGQLILVISTYVIFFLFLYLVRRQIFRDNGKILLIAILFGLLIIGLGVAIRFTPAAALLVPVSIAAILLTIIFDSRVGILATITLAFVGAHLLSFDFEYAFATAFAGALGVYSVRDIKNRGGFYLSAAVVFLGYAFILLASFLIEDLPYTRTDIPWANLGNGLMFAGANAALCLFAQPLLWAFERGFKITTDLTLLELSDTNRPLIKEMSLRAAGTFNHSLQVANLSESAAQAVGAHALLVRVGALYHDIGKMEKAEYFIENQRGGENPHDRIKPRMSALIIANHVKKGVELAKEEGLPQPLINFILEHHGTTRIEYFYRQAIEEEGEECVLESDFRYPGPRPQSKETAILMLADGIEAACRSLDNPTLKRVEGLVNAIVKARIADGQLDDTDLTFRDLAKIKETFVSILMGIHHVRIKYPGQKKDEEPAADEASKGVEEEEIWDVMEVEADEPVQATSVEQALDAVDTEGPLDTDAQGEPEQPVIASDTATSEAELDALEEGLDRQAKSSS
ncbi:MAG: HDIG domain-containing protein [Rhodothermales bacterium]